MGDLARAANPIIYTPGANSGVPLDVLGRLDPPATDDPGARQDEVDSTVSGLLGLIGIDSDLTQRNVDHYEDYSRFDIRLSRTVPLERGSFEYYFEVFNVFDSGNECCTAKHTLTFGSTVSATPEIDHFIPLFPSFGFVWTFGPGAN